MQRDGKERIPGSIDNYVTGVSERSQQSCILKDDRYKRKLPITLNNYGYKRIYLSV